MTTKKTTEKVQKETRPKVLSGVVVSDKMKDTVVVAVSRFVQHPKYRKFVKKVKHYHAHNPGNTKHVGDAVEMVECRPISELKHFKVV